MKKGQMLVELVLAIAVTSIVLVGVSGITSKALSNSGFAQNRTRANIYVTQAMEWIRGSHKADVIALNLAGKNSLCLHDVTNWPVTTGACNQSNCANLNYDGPITTSNCFFRDVTLRNVGTPQLPQVEVKVVVSWKEGSSAVSHTAQQVVNLAQYQ